MVVSSQNFAIYIQSDYNDNALYNKPGSASRQYEANPVFWLATPVGKMGLSCLLVISCFVPAKAKFFGATFCPYNKSFVDWACSVKDGWILFLFSFFWCFYGPWLRLVHKNSKKKNRTILWYYSLYCTRWF